MKSHCFLPHWSTFWFHKLNLFKADQASPHLLMMLQTRHSFYLFSLGTTCLNTFNSNNYWPTTFVVLHEKNFNTITPYLTKRSGQWLSYLTLLFLLLQLIRGLDNASSKPLCIPTNLLYSSFNYFRIPALTGQKFQKLENCFSSNLDGQWVFPEHKI